MCYSNRRKAAGEINIGLFLSHINRVSAVLSPCNLETVLSRNSSLESLRMKAGTHLYSGEKAVISVLLSIHLNSRGQLPSARQVMTRRFPSRWISGGPGSVLK